MTTVRRAARIVLAVIAVMALSGMARAGAVLRFTTVTHGGKETQFAAVVGRNDVYVARNALEGDYFLNAFTTADKAAMDAVDFDKSYVIGVMLGRGTSGWGVTIERVTLQKMPHRRREFCVVVRVEKPKPGQAVVAKPWYAEHTVALPAARFRIDEFHWNIPTAAVVRSTAGATLAVTHAGLDIGGHPIPTGKPQYCKR